ncbi:hypothetical protein Dimus_023293 [Dionaea muscipula]
MGMDSDTLHDSTISVVDRDAGDDFDTLSNNSHLDGASPNAKSMQEFGIAHEFLSRLELNLACASEKLVNLNILMMHVAAKENDFESFALEKDDTHVESIEAAVEFDFLSGILDAEIKNLDSSMASLQKEILDAREVMRSYKHLGEALLVMEDKLLDSEELLKQLQKQLTEMRMQSATFQKIITNLSTKGHYEDGLHASENDEFLNTNVNITMQTSNQQRHVLRMLEKSLARELDLEKKLAESKQTEEELQLRLHYSLQEVFSMEEQITVFLQRLFEADNTAEVLKGTSKELMCRMQSCQFSLNSAIQREAELQSKLMDMTGASNLKEGKLMKLQQKVTEAGRRVEIAEAKSKSLEEANNKLNEELSILRYKTATAEKNVDALERQLREADIQLQCAVAAVDASQEKQNILYSAINDMECVIEHLKSKVTNAESRADCAEMKCSILSETNEELKDDLNSLKARLESLKISYRQAVEAKVAAAKDISLRTKMLADLALQLAIERERLHNQISSLVKENRFLVEKLQVTSNPQSAKNSHDGEEDGESKATVMGERVITVERGSSAANESAKVQRDVSEDGTASDPKLEPVRMIDAGRLGFIFILLAVFVVLLAAVLAMCFLPE